MRRVPLPELVVLLLLVAGVIGWMAASRREVPTTVTPVDAVRLHGLKPGISSEDLVLTVGAPRQKGPVDGLPDAATWQYGAEAISAAGVQGGLVQWVRGDEAEGPAGATVVRRGDPPERVQAALGAPTVLEGGEPSMVWTWRGARQEVRVAFGASPEPMAGGRPVVETVELHLPGSPAPEFPPPSPTGTP